MHPYRDDVEAVRRRIDVLEAEIASREGALRDCEAELERCRAELAHARDELPHGGALPLALVALVGVLGSAVLTMPVGGPRCHVGYASGGGAFEGVAAVERPPTRAFDHALAEAMMQVQAQHAAACERPGGPSGGGRVVLTFANDGAVDTVVAFGGPADDPSTRDCLESVYRSLQLPPFRGTPMSVSGYFYLRPWELDLAE
jgi:hypothetical protein